MGRVIRSVHRAIEPRRLELFVAERTLSVNGKDGSDNRLGPLLSLRLLAFDLVSICRNRESSVRRQIVLREVNDEMTCRK